MELILVGSDHHFASGAIILPASGLLFLSLVAGGLLVVG
jgi:hypothetical protein